MSRDLTSDLPVSPEFEATATIFGIRRFSSATTIQLTAVVSDELSPGNEEQAVTAHRADVNSASNGPEKKGCGFVITVRKGRGLVTAK